MMTGMIARPEAPGAPLRYGPIAQVAHWLTFLLVASEFVLGLVMPDVHLGTTLVPLIAWHLALGGGVLLVLLLRLSWRLLHRPPLPPAECPPWQRRLALVTHFALYAVLIVVPLSGWASASARNWPVRAFGLIPFPVLLPYSSRIASALGNVHVYAIYFALLPLIALHTAAALYHRFVRRDSIFDRMLPG